jgi:DUF1707 SHOCT-like domain/FHA domain
MRPSTDRLAQDENVRASDAERDQAVGTLREQFAQGRLSQETFLYRMDAALAARNRSDLSGLFADLPRQPRRKPWTMRKLFTLLKGPAGSGLVTRRSTAAMPYPASPLPPLPLPPHEDRRFTIGRALACDFTLADLSVSRWHARLYHEDERWLLSDLGSTNGTRLNGWRVTTSVPVRPGDQVTFGSLTFVITDGAPSTA